MRLAYLAPAALIAVSAFAALGASLAVGQPLQFTQAQTSTTETISVLRRLGPVWPA